MRPVHAQVAQQSPTVGGLLGDTHRPGGAAAARIATAVVEDQPVVARQAGLDQQEAEGVRDERPVDEYHRLACPRDLIVQLSPIKTHPFQRCLPFGTWATSGECCRSLLFALSLHGTVVFTSLCSSQ